MTRAIKGGRYGNEKALKQLSRELWDPLYDQWTNVASCLLSPQVFGGRLNPSRLSKKNSAIINTDGFVSL